MDLTPRRCNYCKKLSNDVLFNKCKICRAILEEENKVRAKKRLIYRRNDYRENLTKENPNLLNLKSIFEE